MGKDFRIKTFNEIKADVKLVKPYFADIPRIFLADGNALMMPKDELVKVLDMLYAEFPKLERVGVYGGPLDIREKSLEELKALKDAGLGIIYLGLESGSDKILKLVKKGANAKTMIEAGRKVKGSGIPLSAIIIQGLGGKALTDEHAKETASVLNAMDPDFLGALTLMVCAGTPMEQQIEDGIIELLDPNELMNELGNMLSALELTNCMFRANHPSNYISFKGTLPDDKERLLREIRKASRLTEGDYRPEWLRGL
jgi:radical SAM superfamily enzyme YgiQ (UPF0313 family)